ncbi:MAG: glycosyltransferase family 2 protein [Gemmatimonadaceae bacterium]|nr:glycosyltransferase family 2 protein [Gemmatimonadaceae bacterium]
MHSVSILIPCYHERNFIRACLDSVRAFEMPDGATLEVLVLDGMSTDGTREIVSSIEQSDSRIRMVDNPSRTQSAALNLGVSIATGDYVMRLDAHSVYPPDYLALTLETAIRTGADNTGGVVVTLRRGEGYQSALVQAITTHKFGVGDSGFRTNAAEGEADTVPYGCFKRDVFAKVGLFDERLIRAQDYEMNRRIIAAGGTVWMNPWIQVRYFQQPDLASFIRKQVVYEAPYNAYLWYLAPYAFTPRHAITGVFAAGVIAGLAISPFSTFVRWTFAAVMTLYLLLAILSGVQQAVRYREPRHVIFAPVAFFLYHFLHGTGVLIGLARLATGTAPVQGKPEPWPGAGRFRAWP